MLNFEFNGASLNFNATSSEVLIYWNQLDVARVFDKATILEKQIIECHCLKYSSAISDFNRTRWSKSNNESQILNCFNYCSWVNIILREYGIGDPVHRRIIWVPEQQNGVHYIAGNIKIFEIDFHHGKVYKVVGAREDVRLQRQVGNC